MTDTANNGPSAAMYAWMGAFGALIRWVAG